jgi:hypothetical protein
MTLLFTSLIKHTPFLAKKQAFCKFILKILQNTLQQTKKEQ